MIAIGGVAAAGVPTAQAASVVITTESGGYHHRHHHRHHWRRHHERHCWTKVRHYWHHGKRVVRSERVCD
jgi:hypothetical protein